MRHSQDCLGAGDPCCYGSLAPANAFAHPAPPPSAAHAALLKDAEIIVGLMRRTYGDALPTTTRMIERLAASLRAASPSPGAVEAAWNEAWGRALSIVQLHDQKGTWLSDAEWIDKRDVEWQHSAAQRGAAGGQDG